MRRGMMQDATRDDAGCGGLEQCQRGELSFDAPWVVKQKIRIFLAMRPDVCFDVPWVVKGNCWIFFGFQPDVCFDAPRVVKAKMPFLQKKSRVRWYTTTRNFSYIADCVRFDEISFV